MYRDEAEHGLIKAREEVNNDRQFKWWALFAIVKALLAIAASIRNLNERA